MIRYGDIILSGDLLRGHSDTIILSLLNKKDSYGYELNTFITKISNDMFMLTEATMYTTLKRLEKNEYVKSYWMEGSNTKRKYYSITPLGINYLEEKINEWRNGKKIIDKFLEGEEDE